MSNTLDLSPVDFTPRRIESDRDRNRSERGIEKLANRLDRIRWRQFVLTRVNRTPGSLFAWDRENISQSWGETSALHMKHTQWGETKQARYTCNIDRSLSHTKQARYTYNISRSLSHEAKQNKRATHVKLVVLQAIQNKRATHVILASLSQWFFWWRPTLASCHLSGLSFRFERRLCNTYIVVYSWESTK